MTLEWAPTATIIVALISVVVGPFATRYAQRKARDPDAGWEAAVAALKDDLAKTRSKLEDVSGKLERVSAALDAETQTRVGHEQTIQHQSRLIFALGARNAQLEAAWPVGSTPAPDPAWARDLVVARIVDPGTTNPRGT